MVITTTWKSITVMEIFQQTATTTMRPEVMVSGMAMIHPTGTMTIRASMMMNKIATVHPTGPMAKLPAMMITVIFQPMEMITAIISTDGNEYGVIGSEIMNALTLDYEYT